MVEGNPLSVGLETQPQPVEPATFYFDAGITEQTAQSFINFLRSINKADKTQPLDLIINSNGGSVQAVLDMSRQIRHTENPISTTVETRAMSAGVLLLASGDKGQRFAHEDATIMLHQISFPTDKNQWSMGELFDFTREKMKINRKYFQELELLTGTPTQDLLEMTRNKDLYLNPHQAKDLGIVDEIIPHKKTRIAFPEKPIFTVIK